MRGCNARCNVRFILSLSSSAMQPATVELQRAFSGDSPRQRSRTESRLRRDVHLLSWRASFQNCYGFFSLPRAKIFLQVASTRIRNAYQSQSIASARIASGFSGILAFLRITYFLPDVIATSKSRDDQVLRLIRMLWERLARGWREKAHANITRRLAAIISLMESNAGLLKKPTSLLSCLSFRIGVLRVL